MQRRPTDLTATEFDVLIVGGGAFGAAAAREAALRGLRTALIERGDFGGGASAECFKMVHGGIRYLQHADLFRLRASCQERAAFLRIAPHLVKPLPIAIPTYGYGRQGRALLAAGAILYDLLTLDRNAGIADPGRHIRRSRRLDRERLLELFPHLAAPNLTGAVVFEDGQMYNPARVVLAFVKAAVAAGTVACNYVESLEFLWNGTAVRGVRARDCASGEEFDVRARLVLNAAGPWADYLQRDPRFGAWQRAPFSRDAYFIVDRMPSSEYGLAVQGLSRDKDAVVGRPARHLFTVPWRDKTLVGVWHRLFPGQPDGAQIEPREIESWIAELNAVYPQLQLSLSEVTFAHCGLVPFGEIATETELSFGKQSRIVDHRDAHGIQGLVSLVGIRFTTARADAARALDMLLLQSSKHAPRTALGTREPLPGGDIENFAAFEMHAQRDKPNGLDARIFSALLRNYGTEYRDVLRHAPDADRDNVSVVGTRTLLAEIGYAVEQEMAVKLQDVVMRRTELAAGCDPGRAALAAAAQEMARRLNWSAQRVAEEIADTMRLLERHLARPAREIAANIAAASAGAMLADPSAAGLGTPALETGRM